LRTRSGRESRRLSSSTRASSATCGECNRSHPLARSRRWAPFSREALRPVGKVAPRGIWRYPGRLRVARATVTHGSTSALGRRGGRVVVRFVPDKASSNSSPSLITARACGRSCFDKSAIPRPAAVNAATHADFARLAPAKYRGGIALGRVGRTPASIVSTSRTRPPATRHTAPRGRLPHKSIDSRGLPR
jgi:hypothetical protein